MEKIKNEELLLCNGGSAVFLLMSRIYISLVQLCRLAKRGRR